MGEPRYLLACHAYIELNPVRAGMVAHPGEYRWSSYAANAQGQVVPSSRPMGRSWNWAQAPLIATEANASCSATIWPRAWSTRSGRSPTAGWC
ncbi:hypothetical protein [Halomonas sp.]|uniref:hypothetical protein n=1 Tax=Halomonas sp. TaxID=1486246 RepID=UPI0025BFC1E2|nr:hypothetical protein [Halomonas sp.]